RHLTDQCAFVLHLPASDSMPGSVLVAMGCGLIPVVNRAAGFDTADFGFTVETDDLAALRQRLDDLSCLSPAECRTLAERAYTLATTRYSYAAYSACIE